MQRLLYYIVLYIYFLFIHICMHAGFYFVPSRRRLPRRFPRPRCWSLLLQAIRFGKLCRPPFLGKCPPLPCHNASGNGQYTDQARIPDRPLRGSYLRIRHMVMIHPYK